MISKVDKANKMQFMFISVLLIVIPIRMVNLTVKRGEVCNYSAFIKQSFGFNNQKVLYVVPVSL